MRVCVVGSGGREHALAVALSPTADVVVTPGNPGIPQSVAAPPEEVEADLYVIGPEAPLVQGLADRLRAGGRTVFGPGADGARLEGSKAWMKDVLVSAGVPTARYGVFSDVAPALGFLRSLPGPWVVKTDGLAAGKGVFVTDSLIDAEDDVRAKLAGIRFGDAGRCVVVEEGLSGPEVSVLAVCDGERAVALPPAQDFKRARTGDTGPNTGGMGAYSPVAVATPALVDEVMAGAVEPTLAELRRRGIDYRGVLYAGVMVTPDGPKVLEFNVRFGDPETQVVLPRLDGDLAALLHEAASGRLRSEVRVRDDAAVTVVGAAAGYPGEVRTGDRIDGAEAASAVGGVTVYFAGVGRAADGVLVTAGGRVVAVTGVAATIAGARQRAYEGVSRLHWAGMHYRTDIAAAAAAREWTRR